jgi:hypothetical protein
MRVVLNARLRGTSNRLELLAKLAYVVILDLQDRLVQLGLRLMLVQFVIGFIDLILMLLDGVPSHA